MITIIIMLALLITPAWAVNRNDVAEFLSGRFAPQVQARLIEAMRSNASSCLVEHEGVVYSLCVVGVRKDKSQSMQNSLNLAAQRQSSMKAALNLAMYLDNGKTNTKNYRDKETVNHILRTHYESRIGFNSASKIINGNAFSIVWSEKRASPIADRDFNSEYCTSLYEQALDLYSSGKYNEAAELITEYVSIYDNITAEEIALSGKILFNAGRKDEGFKAMERAYNMVSQ